MFYNEHRVHITSSHPCFLVMVLFTIFHLSGFQGFFTYLYGVSILFLLYVFCFLLQESSCCQGNEQPKPKKPKKEKENKKNKKKEKKEAAAAGKEGSGGGNPPPSGQGNRNRSNIFQVILKFPDFCVHAFLNISFIQSSLHLITLLTILNYYVCWLFLLLICIKAQISKLKEIICWINNPRKYSYSFNIFKSFSSF